MLGTGIGARAPFSLEREREREGGRGIMIRGKRKITMKLPTE